MHNTTFNICQVKVYQTLAFPERIENNHKMKIKRKSEQASKHEGAQRIQTKAVNASAQNNRRYPVTHSHANFVLAQANSNMFCQYNFTQD